MGQVNEMMTTSCNKTKIFVLINGIFFAKFLPTNSSEKVT